MKALKVLSFVLIVGLFAYLVYFIITEEEQMTEQLPLPFDSTQTFEAAPAAIETFQEDTLHPTFTAIFDYKAEVSDAKLQLFQQEELLFERPLNEVGFHSILSSDLNLDEKPEFWLHFVQNKRSKFLAFQWEGAKLISLNFPSIKGRQAFGYIGNDSLYLEKGLLVRDFQFASDPTSDFASGFRKCYYALGKDKSFVLKKTIDYEKR